MAAENGVPVPGSGPERYERYMAPIMAPFVAAVLDEVAPTAGGALLDLACGTGLAARAAAPLVGPEGRIAGVDADSAVLEFAAAHSPAGPAVEWVPASADELPYPDAEFDAIVGQQAAQFFPDLDAALGEAARVLRPGGRIALTVWSSIDRCPFFLAQRLAVDDIAGPEVASLFDAAFSCPSRRLVGALRTAGLVDVASREVTAKVRLPRLEEYAPAQLTTFPWGRAVAEARADGLAAYARTLADLLFPYVTADQTALLPFSAVLATATRPADR